MLARGQARLADIQAQQVEVGRIRLGTSTPKTARSGKTYNEPVKLDRFRLTSRSRQLVEHAAQIYGGDPGEWTPQGGSPQWEVIVQRDWLGVIVPANSCSQYYEQWANGRCQVRCSGTRELINDVPCLCGPDPERRACKPYTRLSLMLAEMPGVGIWRLETHGYYAAAELPAVADLLSVAGGNVPARLEMEQRQAEVPDPRNQGKTIIAKFMVPVLHVEATPAELVSMFTPRAAVEAARTETPAIEAPPEPSWSISRDLSRAFYNRIAEAMSIQELEGQSKKIADCRGQLTGDDLQALREAYVRRLDQLRTADPFESESAGQPAPSAPPPPAAAVLDRQKIWMEINTWAGYNNTTLSGLKARYVQFGGQGDLNQASAEQLVQFRDWLARA